MPPEASTSAPSAAEFDQAFSPVAVKQATHRAALFGLAARARFAVGDLTDLQDEARQQLPLADLKDRVVVVATAP